jgi:hypothetical protein
MTLDDLRKPWTAEATFGSGMPRLDSLISEVAKRRRDARMRDFWVIFSLLAAAGGSLFFNWWARDTVDLMSQIAVLSTVVFAVVVTLVLLNARRVKSHDSWTLRARLEREIERLGRQAALLLNVGYWFLLPMFLMIVITSIAGQHERTGSYVPNAVSWGLYLANLSVAALTVWLCRRESTRTLIPLLSRLKELHRDLIGQSSGSA